MYRAGGGWNSYRSARSTRSAQAPRISSPRRESAASTISSTCGRTSARIARTRAGSPPAVMQQEIVRRCGAGRMAGTSPRSSPPNRLSLSRARGDGHDEIAVRRVHARGDQPVAAERLADGVRGDEVGPEPFEPLEAALVGQGVAGDRVVVGREHQEADPAGAQDVRRTLQDIRLGPLHVDHQQVDPFERAVVHQAGDRHDRQLALEPVALAAHSRGRTVRAAQGRVDEVAREVVELEVGAAGLEVHGVRLDQHRPCPERPQRPHRVVAPEAPELDDRLRRIARARAGAEPLDDAMDDELLLRLVVPPQAADDLGHILAVVAAGHDPRAVVHDLDADAVLDLHLTGVRRRREPVDVAA